uniref:Uncharacterized protein n=1 Tax=Anguilla anguilla TaxID=7936 RepID=A0A0E9QL93_ANGAN
MRMEGTEFKTDLRIQPFSPLTVNWICHILNGAVCNHLHRGVQRATH